MATRSRRLSPSKASCAAKTQTASSATRGSMRSIGCPGCRFAAVCLTERGPSLELNDRFLHLAGLAAVARRTHFSQEFTALLAHGPCFEPILEDLKTRGWR